MPEHTDLPDRTSEHAVEDRPVLVLDVVRGSTRFPRRPVLTDRFLVGGSPACDLHLGGENLPPYHSLIVHEEGVYRWEAVMPEPAVLHNGRRDEWFELHDGDRVTIGEFELAVHLELIEDVAESVGIEATDLDAADTITFQDRSVFELVSKMSAADLADRLEREMAVVEAVERRQRLGAEGLLYAARERVASTAPPSNASADAEASLRGRIDGIVQRFNRFAADLQGALDAVRAGGPAASEHLEAALAAHARLSVELQSLGRTFQADEARTADSQRSAA
ncbi:MAG: FHA domain-containing protein [Planctomycetaceae bacterium]